MTDAKLMVTIHMVASVDGFIAKTDNSVSWFETKDYYDRGVAEAGTDFWKTIDCFVMGSRTYEHALELSKEFGWAYGDVPTIVLSHRRLPIDRTNIELYSAGLGTLVEQRLQPRYQNVWVVGGPSLAGDFIRLKLADELRMSIIPIILGDGTPFFSKGQEHLLHLKDVTALKSGIVELCYEIRKD